MYKLTNEDKQLISNIMTTKAGASMLNLDSLIESTEKIPSHDVLYRGVCNTELRKLLEMGLGDTLELNRPMSFTPSLVCAEHFTNEVYHTGAIIQVAASRPCMNYYELAVDYINDLTEEEFEDFAEDETITKLDYYVMLADEMEHIYKSGTILRLSSIEETSVPERNDTMKIYHFEIVC